MKIDNIELSKDKNGNAMKILEVGNNKVFVNSKYEKAIFEVINKDSDIEIVKVGNFWKVTPESLGIEEKPRSNYRGEIIKEAQQRKETSIEAAQKRTSEMWAKRSSAELVAHHPAYQNLEAQDIEPTIEELARNINKMDIRPEPFGNHL